MTECEAITMGAQDLKNPTTDVPATQTNARVPAAWLDSLLGAILRLRPETSPEEAVTALLDAGRDALGEEVALGVCIPAPEGQIVIRKTARISQSEQQDPARLFPGYPEEEVIDIPEGNGATLHIGWDTEWSTDRMESARAFVGRLNTALGMVLRRSQLEMRASHHAEQARSLEAQVIQSDKLASLGQIAAGIVHELNNPLTSIVAYSDYLRRRWEDRGEQPADVERLRRINEAAERILQFSRDLIAYSRPAVEVPGPVMIHDVIERALVFCEHVTERERVTIRRDFQAGLHPILGVSGQLTQVFVNLFTNAYQAMKRSGGVLTVATTSVASRHAIEIAVHDEGAGIEAAHLEQIFEPFYTTKTDGTGTGLGLSIVRKIVDGHGGTISARGNEPQGTVFIIRLPMIERPNPDS